jgi:hypothetical protein
MAIGRRLFSSVHRDDPTNLGLCLGENNGQQWREGEDKLMDWPGIYIQFLLLLQGLLFLVVFVCSSPPPPPPPLCNETCNVLLRVLLREKKHICCRNNSQTPLEKKKGGEVMGQSPHRGPGHTARARSYHFVRRMPTTSTQALLVRETDDSTMPSSQPASQGELRARTRTIARFTGRTSERASALTYRELDEAEDEHGPEAAEVGVGEEAAEEGEEEDGADEVGHHVGRLRQREVHLPEHVGDEVVPHRRYRHDLERLDACDYTNTYYYCYIITTRPPALGAS